MRLQKYLAIKGIDSRRKCEKLIVEGKVTVNDKIETKLGISIDPAKDIVKLNNQILRADVRKKYIILNKPKGYLCTTKDSFGRKIIYELLPDVKEKVYYAGRLDYYSEGLVLLTNDGELINKLTHPKNKIEKTYLVKINKKITSEHLAEFEKGIPLTDLFTTSRCKIETIDKNSNLLKIIIKEGKKRQIRRMFSYLNYKVLNLKRIKIGNLYLGNLKTGHYRVLKKEEIVNLKKFL